MSHHTQRSFLKQLDTVRMLIISHGGIENIEKEIGMSHFVYYISAQVGCLPRKAREYFQIVKMSALAEARIKKLDEAKNANKM